MTCDRCGYTGNDDEVSALRFRHEDGSVTVTTVCPRCGRIEMRREDDQQAND